MKRQYPLCDQTVTLYRLENGAVVRWVERGCYYTSRTLQTETDQGIRRDRDFLLILPDKRRAVQPGDRVLPGEGPEIGAQDWPRFIPAFVEELGQVGYVQAYYLHGRLCHVEAGRKERSL